MIRYFFSYTVQTIVLIALIIASPANAADISREPMHGYWVGYAFGKNVNTLFQNWEDAAAALCGGADMIGPKTQPPKEPKGMPDLYCYFQGKDFQQYTSFQGWSDACQGWNTAYLHDPKRTCSEAGEKPPCQCDRYGNPISLSTKAKIQVEVDYKPIHSLEFSRYYNSGIIEARSSAMSRVWRHTYTWNLISTIPIAAGAPVSYSTDYRLSDRTWSPRITIPKSGENFVSILGPDGYGYNFVSKDEGITWASDADVSAKLTVSKWDQNNRPSEWQLRREDSDIYIFDHLGRLVEKEFANGGNLRLTYSDEQTSSEVAQSSGLLIAVTDNYGRSINFSYDGKNRVSKFSTPSMEEFVYEYDNNDNLISVRYPDGLRRIYHYNEPEYQPQQHISSYGNLLTGISDEVSPGQIERFSIYKYSSGRAVSTEHANGVNRYTFYDDQFTDPLGVTRRHVYSRELGRMVPAGFQEPRADGTGTESVGFSYDQAGNIVEISKSYDRTCFAYESGRRLEKVRVEGGGQNYCYVLMAATSLPAGARKVTTVWHPTLPKPVTIVEPKKREDISYDNSGKVLTRMLRATADESGVLGIAAPLLGNARVFSYTYDSNGKLLTESGPRKDVSSVTKYSYDGAGNLTQIVNAAGHTTTFSNYDPHGRPGRVVDSNGLITDIGYNWRGLPTAVTVGGETTTYSYNGAGRLTNVLLPSGASLTYGYDAAGRQTSISDADGNLISFNLDNLGNRLSEKTQDKSGTLIRQVERVYDSLSRLKQITGSAQ